MSITTIRWKDWSGTGLEHLVLTTNGKAITADSILISRESVFAACYRVRLDLHWRVLEATVSVIGSDSNVAIRSIGEGQWTDQNGNHLAHLDGAIDIDLSASPFTNTLPVRRMQFDIGESADITTAYFSFPDLTLTLDPQRYTRLAEHTYRFDSRDSDFTSDIEFDADGFVRTYPGLFRRVA